MRSLVPSLVVLVGCDGVFALTPIRLSADAPPSDGPPDVAIDAQYCHGNGLLQLCFSGEAASPRSLVGTLDTSTDPRCDVRTQPLGPGLCVIRAESINVSDPLTVTGSRALVLVGMSITIANVLDLSSITGGKLGPAAQAHCGDGGQGADGGAGENGGGGGAAGSFNFPGGFGANAANGTVDGAAALAPLPMFDVRGGCPGFAGGLPQGSGVRAHGGAAGGALYAISTGEIVVTTTGIVSAGGAGGGGGRNGGGGGGGGGSGGMIAFDAAKVTIHGKVTARGGGGGGGGGYGTASTAGGAGGDPIGGTQATAGAPGGGTTTPGKAGGPGCDGREGGRPDHGSLAGGGGGGGACGILRIYGVHDVTTTGITVPMPNAMP